ncbi:pleckstrin homology domain-containing family G member 4B-like isoform X2 [Brienomyrus brachyistius]|uniref:pleckstrin homology domain-containing family G member 4B-like isoform X2 n=1 Tax=Brienomyrus brachyistius TaxID=42636 RepID=UPI0020B23B3F|nr:pleckstrin homology domain-containing family G member 4B-like isoform X2 [Brienomyrus brachyistius]
MNPESLDASIQGALSVLYPPFEATAPTVLSQLFRVIEERYHGDSLQCLLDFLIPAKHILESVQQAACAAYSDVLFRCEGWPLCLREKVVIQLAALNPLLLRPGDFYLQVEPFADQAARIVLKSLLEDHRQVEETPIPETSYSCIFTEEWLRDINDGRHGTPLRHCLLSTDQGIVKVPWEQVANPEFIDKPKAMATIPLPPDGHPESPGLPCGPSAFSLETRILPAKDGIAVSLCLMDAGNPQLMKVDQVRSNGKPVGWVSPNTWDNHSNRELEGDYVDLVEFTKEKNAQVLKRDQVAPELPALQPVRRAPPIPFCDPVYPAPPTHPRDPSAPPTHPHDPSAPPTHPRDLSAPPIPCLESMICSPTHKTMDEHCIPCIRRGLAEVCEVKELRGRYRESYLEAQQNPVNFEGNTLEALEECVTTMGVGEAEGKDVALGFKKIGADSEQALPCCHSNHHCPPTAQSEDEFQSQQTIQDLQNSSSHPGKVLSLSSSFVSETPKKCLEVPRKVNRSISDIRPDMIPNMNRLQFKKLNAFGLVYPKTDKRRSVKQDAVQAGVAETASLHVNEHQKKVQTPQVDRTQDVLADVPYLLARPSPEDTSSYLLYLGIICLPGSRDRTGRAVVEVYGDHQGWKSQSASSQQLCKLLLHFHFIPRKEVADLGMTLVVDVRKAPPPPQFYKALLMVQAQEQALNAVHCIVMMVDKDTNPRPEKHPGLQMEVVTSLKALHKVVDGHQLTASFEGTFPYSHPDWLKLHQKLDPFVSDLQEASKLLQRAIGKFEGNKKTDTLQDVEQCIHEEKTLMKEVLEDTGLVTLQREGGAILARLRREESRFSHSEDYRDTMELVTSLYNDVEEQVHTLVMKSNYSLQHLDFLLKLKELESRFTKIREWFNAEGEQQLLKAETVEDSLEQVEQTMQNFDSFLAQAAERQHQATTLVTEVETILESSYAETEIFQTMLYTFKSSLGDFKSRAEQCHTELKTFVGLFHFCEKAIEVSKDCAEYLEQIKPSCCLAKNSLGTLRKYQERFDEFSVERFQEVKTQACALKGSRGMKVWNVAWLRFQEVHKQLEERLQDPGKVQQPVDISRGDGANEESAVSVPFTNLNPSLTKHVPTYQDYGANAVLNFNATLQLDNEACTEPKTRAASKNATGESITTKEERNHTKSLKECSAKCDLTSIDPLSCQWFTWHRTIGRSLSEGSTARSVCHGLQAPDSSPGHGQPSHHILQAAQSFQISRHGSFCSEDSSCRPATRSLQTEIPCSFTTQAAQACDGEKDKASRVLRFRRIIEELLLTEREYVRSLSYVMTHYYPLLEKPDVPQDLRGQRGRIFSNLEKLHDFHCHFFLKELESCLQEPLRVGRCFLRHRESFSLYALYSKNKPQSDALLIHHAHGFFQKQQELGDKMDLSSYLLKPVQRISKYNLLLQDLLSECDALPCSERAEIQAALEVVRFQLRHGNDLLTMEDIQGCDVNLKEQGPLIRQNEFLVSFKKKKCFRHVFLFQELILFSKTKRTTIGNDIYVYKQSFKTSDIGMTHNSGNSGLCFEIWFRRRNSQDTYILQADKKEVKEAWANDLEQILWEQAVRSRELRIQERVFMGMGSKPFMDIQPSDEAICDRAIKCVPTGRDSKMLSQGHALVSHTNSTGSGSTCSTAGSTSSSSSGRGSLPPASYFCGHSQRRESSQGISVGVMEEDDLDNDSIHLLGNSSESSAESTSGFSGSDHSCQSAIGGDTQNTTSSSISICSKVGGPHGVPPLFRDQGFPVDSRKHPPTVSKPLALPPQQVPGKVKAVAVCRKSTEV